MTIKKTHPKHEYANGRRILRVCLNVLSVPAKAPFFPMYLTDPFRVRSSPTASQ